MLEVVVKLSAIHMGGRKMVLYSPILKLVLQETCVSLFCNIVYNIYGEICGIPENVPRFLKNDFHISEEQHLRLASLYTF